ncbi:phage tail protein [Leptospira santarosai]|uniref:tail fiber protein n=1 Tax=Leptospira santarosai TaxID=28183 RepID=UPI0026E1B62C|nr:tail fiber protein [Leptospira santarosai]MDO6383412.1 tail fiber protein [Leptospira santarosai]
MYANFPIKIPQNASVQIRFTNLQGVANPYALIRLQVKKNSRSSEILLSCDILPTDPGCDFENGIVAANFIPGQTRAMLGDEIYKYDLLVNRQGRITYDYHGSFELIGTITRDGDSFNPVEYQSILEKLASTLTGFGAWMIGVDASYWTTLLGSPNLVLERCLRWLRENKLAKLNPFASGRILKSGATDTEVLVTGIMIDSTDNLTGVKTLSLLDPPTLAEHATRRDWVESEIVTRLNAGINGLINGAPGALDTLQELSNAMGNDPNFATTITNLIATKVPLSQKGATNGVATLGLDGKVPSSQLPPSSGAVTSVNGQTGAVTLTFPVTSVNGQTGTIVIDPIPLGTIIEDALDQFDPARYKIPNGQSYSRTTYSTLWNLINRSITSITPATDRINSSAHGRAEGDLVKFSFTGGGITALTSYYVRNPTSNDFQISVTKTGAIVDLTSSQSGTMIVNTEYGFGDGSTTFNVPDRRGLFPRGAGVHGTRAKASGGNYDGGSVGYEGQDQFQGFGIGAVSNGGSAVQPGGSIGTGNTLFPISDGTNGTPRKGNETTPASVGVRFKVRIA